MCTVFHCVDDNGFAGIDTHEEKVIEEEEDYDDIELVPVDEEQPDPVYITILEGSAIVLAVLVLYAFMFHADETHFHVANMLARIGHAEAQHIVGQRYMQGKGTRRNTTRAMEWFRLAAEQGHAHASYNLAVGLVKGFRCGLHHKDAQKFLKYALDNGVPQAKDAWAKIYDQ